MSDFLIFDTFAEAETAADNIWTNVRTFWVNQGLTLSFGKILGQRGNGVNNPDSGIANWDYPRQRITDGKWVIRDPADKYSAIFSRGIARQLRHSNQVTVETMPAPENEAEQWF